MVDWRGDGVERVGDKVDEGGVNMAPCVRVIAWESQRHDERELAVGGVE